MRAVGSGTEAGARGRLPAILEQHRPDVVFYLAGADPYREDQLGGLALTIDGLKRRDTFVMGATAKAHAPLAIVLAGGYARHTDDTVEIHCNTVRVAAERVGGNPENLHY